MLNHLEYEKNASKIERVHLSSLLQQYLENRRSILEQANISLIYKFPKDIYVWGDEFKIEEIMDNYFTNAIHHVKEKKKNEKIIKILIGEKEEKVRLSQITDNTYILHTEN